MCINPDILDTVLSNRKVIYNLVTTFQYHKVYILNGNIQHDILKLKILEITALVDYLRNYRWCAKFSQTYHETVQSTVLSPSLSFILIRSVIFNKKVYTITTQSYVILTVYICLKFSLQSQNTSILQALQYNSLSVLLV